MNPLGACVGAPLDRTPSYWYQRERQRRMRLRSTTPVTITVWGPPAPPGAPALSTVPIFRGRLVQQQIDRLRQSLRSNMTTAADYRLVLLQIGSAREEYKVTPTFAVNLQRLYAPYLYPSRVSGVAAMNPYAALVSHSPQHLGAPDVVATQEGLQKLTPQKNAEIASLLSSLYFVPGSTEPEGYTRFVALPMEQARAAGGNVTATALATLRAQSLPVAVEYQSASRQSVTVYVAQSLTAAATLAQGGSNKAIFDPNQAPPKETKAEGTTLLVSAAAGGAAGFLVAGPIGAGIGAGAGLLLANWLA